MANEKIVKWELDDVLLTLRAHDEDINITVGQSCEGIMVMGASGSGKTSGPLNTIQLAQMRNGFGMLNLCVKKDECERVCKLAKLAGRGKDIRIMRLGGDVRFNFLDSLRDGGADAVTSAFRQINQALLGQVEENEWTMASQQHLSNLVKLFLLAGKKLEVSELRLAADSLETHKKLLIQAEQRVNYDTPDGHTLKMVAAYFAQEWKGMGEKTKASVIMSLTPTMNPFSDGPMREHFCKDSNFNPKMLRDGTILIVDIPCVDEMGVYGISAGVIMKYMVQRMIAGYYGNGKTKADNTTRPVCIVCDECHYLVTTTDSEFVTTSRSMRGSLFYLTQNLNNFYRRSARTIEAETGTLLSELHGVRIMCQNEDKKTYEWFASILGQEWKGQFNQSANFAGPIGQGSAGANLAMHKENQISQRDFAVGLARGGKQFQFVVTAFLQQAGRVFANEKMYKQVAFQQLAFADERKVGCIRSILDKLFN